jgi:hypothetical protein
MSEIRQKKLKQEILVNRGKKPMGKMMKEVGYSKAYSKNPQQWLRTKAGKEISKWIDFEIQQIIKRMDDERWLADYKELADTLVNLKKLQQLIEGKPTEIQKIQAFDKLLDDFANKKYDEPTGEIGDKGKSIEDLQE